MRDSMSLTERLSFPTNGLGATDQNDEMVEVRNRVHQVVIETLGTAMLSADVDETSLLPRLSLVVDQALEAEDVPLSRPDREALAREIADEILGYGPLQRFLKDETVTEIMVNNHREIYIERGVLGDGGRQVAGRLAGERHHPAAVAERACHDHPQVRDATAHHG
jgi:pilus assembly protein CpaF